MPVSVGWIQKAKLLGQWFSLKLYSVLLNCPSKGSIDYSPTSSEFQGPFPHIDGNHSY